MKTLLWLLNSVVITVLAIVTIRHLKQHREQQKLSKQRQVEIYQKLSDLHGCYSRLTTTIFEQRSEYEETKNRYRDLASEMVDLFGKDERLEFRDETMAIFTGYETAKAQRDAMSMLLDRMEKHL